MSDRTAATITITSAADDATLEDTLAVLGQWGLTNLLEDDNPAPGSIDDLPYTLVDDQVSVGVTEQIAAQLEQFPVAYVAHADPRYEHAGYLAVREGQEGNMWEGEAFADGDAVIRANEISRALTTDNPVAAVGELLPPNLRPSRPGRRPEQPPTGLHVPKRVLVALTVPDDLDTRQVAEWLTSLGSEVDATVWAPAEFGLTLADRDATPEDLPLLETVTSAFNTAPTRYGDDVAHRCDRCPDRDPNYSSMSSEDRDAAWDEHLRTADQATSPDPVRLKEPAVDTEEIITDDIVECPECGHTLAVCPCDQQPGADTKNR